MTSNAPSTPPAEVEIDEPLMRSLLHRQHPDLAGLEIVPIDAGWDNVMARLGDDLALRLPRRAVADANVRVEQRWLPELAPRLPLPVPIPVRLGSPTGDYPFAWSVVPWFEGQTANLEAPAAEEATVLASFLRALHRPAPEDAPKNPHRDGHLRTKQEQTETRMRDLEALGEPLADDLLALWHRALACPIDTDRCWIAGDLHARNVLVRGGRLAAILDWGDLCAGDRACDLASVWALFDSAAARGAALEAYDATAATILRAQGWALFFGVILLQTGLVDFPPHQGMGRATLARLLEDVREAS